MRLENRTLEVTLSPEVGGTITGVRHKATGLDVLGKVPWQVLNAPLPSLAARDEREWLTRYSGGWPLLFPNGGDACTVDGVFHGFHGESSVAPWTVETVGGPLLLTRQFSSIPAFIRRRLSLEGETLRIEEELRYGGSRSIDVIWAHHPTFGSDLLASAVEITCGGCDVRVEAQYDPIANPLEPDARGRWPRMQGKVGTVDLGIPCTPWASLVYLENFAEPWVAIRRTDDAIAACLTWDRGRFPCAWLWYELEGTAEPPWNGHTRLIGVEPATTPCALGLAEARRGRSPLLRLEPDSVHTASVTLHVFKPAGPVLTGPAEHGTSNSN